MADTITAYPRIADVVVNMTILKPAPLIGLGNLLILNKVGETPKLDPHETTTTKPNNDSGGSTQSGNTGGNTQATNPSGTMPVKRDSQGRSDMDFVNGVLLRKKDPKSGAVYREYRDINAVAADYDTTSPVYKKAQTYFAQPNPSDRVAVLEYDNDIDDALGAFWFSNWTFAIFATGGQINDDTMHASNIFEANKDHFLVIQSDTTLDFSPYHGQDYTIGVKHDLSENMDAALVGAIASLTPGSVNWKFKELTGITPEAFTVPEYTQLNNVHAIGYIDMFGKNQTTAGTTLSGEYIDNEHGDLWVKTHIQSALEKKLQDTPKVSYDQIGINSLRAIVYNVLEQAFELHIILRNDDTGKGEFSVSASPRSAQKPLDISRRHYPGLSFWYHRAGAIDTVTVNGLVQSDTYTDE